LTIILLCQANNKVNSKLLQLRKGFFNFTKHFQLWCMILCVGCVRLP
jgi:hypothetical protein